MSRRGAVAALSGMELMARLAPAAPSGGIVQPTAEELARHSVVIRAAHRFLKAREGHAPAIPEALRSPLPPFLDPRPLVRLPVPEGLTSRWYALRPHPEHWRLWNTNARFCVVPAGRRAGKTEIAKRRLVIGCLVPPHPEARFFAAAPTWQQAKRIWWNDLKALSPRAMVRDWSDGELWIKYVTGATLQVLGLDEPSRIEGVSWDGGVLDEFANMAPTVWSAHLLPIMTERGGWCWFIGVPEGRNHYYKLYLDARKEENKAEWDVFTWSSSTVLTPDAIALAMRTMDEDLFAQEFEGSFRSFKGRVYKPFDEKTHTARLLPRYNPDKPLVFCFDFNVEPGAAVVCQEMILPSGYVGTGVIGQVHIPYDSDTLAVCRRLGLDWAGQRAPILVYGDATGGQRRAEAVLGHNWKLVRQGLRSAFPRLRIIFKVPAANPRERARINCMNSRLKTRDGAVRLMVDATEAPAVVMDLEGVRYLEGGSGEIAKKGKLNEGLTHWCFKPGTLVSTPAGPVAIEDIRTGDLVDTPLGPLSAVGAPRGRAPELMLTVMVGKERVTCTPGHRWLTERGWVEAGQLRPGLDHVRASVPPACPVAAIEPAAAEHEPVCIAVPGAGCFLLASGLIVRNSDALGYYAVARFPILDQSAQGGGFQELLIGA